MNREPLEKTIVKKIIAALRAEGAGCAIKTHGGAYQEAGIPDILCIAPVTGRAVGIEVKRPGRKATALQAAQIKRMNEAGAVAGVAHDVEEALELLDEANKAYGGSISEQETSSP